MNQSNVQHSLLRFPDTSFDVVAIAASAGGLNALSRVLAAIDASFPAALLLVQHLDPRTPSMMASILARQTRLRIKQADTNDCLLPGVAFIAPPDFHLLVSPNGILTLTQSKPVHFVRPSADLLFASVAESFGERSIAVVLSGTGMDGSDGVRAVSRMKGCVIAQSLESSEFNGMPAAAIATGVVDYILPLEEIGTTLLRLVKTGCCTDAD